MRSLGAYISSHLNKNIYYVNTRGFFEIPCEMFDVFDTRHDRAIVKTRIVHIGAFVTENSSAKRLTHGERSVRPCIIKLMLNEWLRGGVISGRSASLVCYSTGVKSERLFIQGARRATVSSRFLAETRDRPPSSLSLTLSFVSSVTLAHAKFSNSCHPA